RLRDPQAPDEVKEACALLGIALEIQEPGFWDIAAETLVAAMSRTMDSEDLTRRAKGVGVVCARLEVSQAAAVAGTAAESATAAMQGPSFLLVLSLISQVPPTRMS